MRTLSSTQRLGSEATSTVAAYKETQFGSIVLGVPPNKTAMAVFRLDPLPDLASATHARLAIDADRIELPGPNSRAVVEIAWPCAARTACTQSIVVGTRLDDSVSLAPRIVSGYAFEVAVPHECGIYQCRVTVRTNRTAWRLRRIALVAERLEREARAAP